MRYPAWWSAKRERPWASSTSTNSSRREWSDLTSFLYRSLLSAAYCVAFPWLAKKYATGLGERRGLYSEEKKGRLPDGPLWFHAVSVGEVQSAWPLLKILAREGIGPEGILLSTTTPTGREMACRVASGLFHEHLYYPWDIPWIVRRSLDTIRPRAFAVLETEIWPLMLDGLRERGIPAILVNGRFSDKTAGNIRSHLHFWHRVYKSFSLLLVRSERDRELLLEIGLEERRIQVTGDCKIDAILLRKEEADLGRARAVLGETGPVFLAGSTHPGEEEVVLEAFQRLKTKIPSARLIVAPRHPQRSSKVLELAKGAAPAALLSEVEKEKKGRAVPWDILVADRIGVLFDLYGVVEGAFV
ncbi:MAG: glycosyltransferase N-terminal domain-containing protein, partial [Thermovirgaceae bacterium]